MSQFNGGTKSNVLQSNGLGFNGIQRRVHTTISINPEAPVSTLSITQTLPLHPSREPVTWYHVHKTTLDI